MTSSLDLSEPAPQPAGPLRSKPESAQPVTLAPGPRLPRIPALRRAGNEEHTVLSSKAPLLALNRIQSAIGLLTIQALVSDAVGDLRLGCAYELRSGQSSTVQQVGGRSTAPLNSRTPMISAKSEHFQRISIDLRHSTELARFVVYGFSESNRTLQWAGTLLTTTAGGARIELPLDRAPATGVTVLLSGFNIDGEFVLRAEMQSYQSSIQEACRAYGFDRITWLDAGTPAD